MVLTNITNERPIEIIVTGQHDAHLARDRRRGICEWDHDRPKTEPNIGKHVREFHQFSRTRTAKDAEICPYCEKSHSKKNRWRCNPKTGKQGEQFPVDSQPLNATYPYNTPQEAGEWRKEALEDLKSRFCPDEEAITHGEQTAGNLYSHLLVASHPNTDESQGDIEIRFCTSDEDCEKAVIDSKVPIIAENQQPLQWKSDELPIKETFDQWRHDEDLMVYVQPSSRPRLKESYEKRTIREVAEKFLTDGTPKDPWNLLDCRCPFPNVHPKFLVSYHCRLLHFIQDGSLKNKSAQRDAASTVEVWQYKMFEKGMLIGQAGANSDFHIDSNGWGTWITVQQGKLGFLFMANFSKEDREAWRKDRGYNNGKVRYVVLRPKQTIWFPPGTVHAVVRLEVTVSITGHILRSCDITIWLEVLETQRDDPKITNEDMKDENTLRMLDSALNIIQKRIQHGDVDAIGGSEETKRNVATIEVRLHPDLMMGVTNLNADTD
ncbi:hypothetical protein HZ326_28829 [Fusarium oxysporum f. sp. albedinis]|nr:hypothetical protein HZ326_28829 [Fusarium oxysporum f. sp. albedinis]